MLQLVFHISNREGRGQKESTEMTQGHNEDNSTVTDVLRKILSSRSKIDLWPAAARSFFFLFSILLYVSVLSFFEDSPLFCVYWGLI